MKVFTKQFLIDELYRFIEENGKIPVLSDMKRSDGYPNSTTYQDYFGTWNNALHEAGLNNYVKYTKEFLLSEINRFVNENGRIPKCKDMLNRNGYPGYNTYIRVFGSWKIALEESGFKLFEITEDYLISELHRFVEENDRVPNTYDMTGSNGYPSTRTYLNYFGTWNNTLEIANLDITRCMSYTNEFLISELYRFVDENDRVPFKEDMLRSNGYPSFTVYVRTFGSWNNALIEADLPLNLYMHSYDGTETCTICGISDSSKWRYDENDNRMCIKCASKKWRRDNPDKVREKNYKHRQFGFNPINERIDNYDGHHLHLEDKSDFIIYMPKFLHILYWHSSNIEDTMTTINAIALDFWINEDFYNDLYYEDDIYDI